MGTIEDGVKPGAAVSPGKTEFGPAPPADLRRPQHKGREQSSGMHHNRSPRRVTVTTLTPVLNEERHVRQTVAALRAQDIAEEAEFILIHAPSTDRTRAILTELAAEDPRIRILDNPRGQTATALNIGLRAARGEYVARIDGHARYPAHYLSRAIERLQRGGVDWVAGPQIPVGTDSWSRRVATALRTPLATGGSGRWDRDLAGRAGDEVELGTGVFTGVWRRVTLDRDAGWDEGWPVNQDSEMAARVLRRGGRIVSLPELGAEYTPRNSLRGLANQYRRYGMYRAKTTLRHPWTLRAPHAVLPGVVMSAGLALLAPRQLRMAARALLAVYSGTVVVESSRVAEDARDALGLSMVFLTMHVSWGGGFLIGLVRFALPSGRRAALAGDLRERGSGG